MLRPPAATSLHRSRAPWDPIVYPHTTSHDVPIAGLAVLNKDTPCCAGYPFVGVVVEDLDGGDDVGFEAERRAVAEVVKNLVADVRIGVVHHGHDALPEHVDVLLDMAGAELAECQPSFARINRTSRRRFRVTFEAINEEFKQIFPRMFRGGRAHLTLTESEDVLDAGIEITAQPPGKKLQSLTLLSGGEQALTATALIFALFLTNPAPICVLDEVDAPLDDANVERFCDLLDAMVAQTNTRYLIVTHNAVSMARMHRLFGVTMVEPGVSRLVSVNLHGAEALLAAGADPERFRERRTRSLRSLARPGLRSQWTKAEAIDEYFPRFRPHLRICSP